MSHLFTIIAIVIAFVLISLVMDRLTLRLLRLKPTWRQVFTITGTIFGLQLLLALPSIIDPKTPVGPVLSLVSIVTSVVVWCILLRKLFQLKVLKSLLGVLIFYALTTSFVGVVLVLIHAATKVL